MANLDPWAYAEKTLTEHAEQVALFRWSNMARLFGCGIANRVESYNIAGWAKSHHENIMAGKYGDIAEATPLIELKWLHAIHNQGHGDAIRGGKAKAEGVKAGVADIFLPVPGSFRGTDAALGAFCHGLYIELKRKDSGSPSAIQLEFQTDMRAAGYKSEIIHGWELARDEILSYLGKA